MSSSEIRKYINLLEGIFGNNLKTGNKQTNKDFYKDPEHISHIPVPNPSKNITHNQSPFGNIKQQMDLKGDSDKNSIYYKIKIGEKVSIEDQKAAISKDPVVFLMAVIEYNYPISKMIQWTAAKRVKELGLSSHLGEEYLDHLDPSVRDYLENS